MGKNPESPVLPHIINQPNYWLLLLCLYVSLSVCLCLSVYVCLSVCVLVANKARGRLW